MAVRIWTRLSGGCGDAGADRGAGAAGAAAQSAGGRGAEGVGGAVPRPAARRLLRYGVSSRPSGGGRPLRHPGCAVSRGRAALRLPRFVLRVHRRRVGRAGSRKSRWDASWSRISGPAHRCAPWRADAVSIPPWGSPRWMALPMGTRPGSLDPGIILWLQQQKGWTVDRVEHFLYADCGLKGLSGVSNDMRTLLASEAPLANWRWNISSIMSRARRGRWRAAWAASTGWCSPRASVSAARRSALACCIVCIGWASRLTRRQTRRAVRCDARDSALPAYMIPTDEEVVIARHTLALIERGVKARPKFGYACQLRGGHQ